MYLTKHINPNIFFCIERVDIKQILKMGFLWRRRSSLLKIVVLLSAVWFTIVFLIYTEDHRNGSSSAVGGSGSGNIPSHNNVLPPLSLKGDFNGINNEIDTDTDNDINGLESVINDVILSGNDKEQQHNSAVGGKNQHEKDESHPNIAEDGMFIFLLFNRFKNFVDL